MKKLKLGERLLSFRLESSSNDNWTKQDLHIHLMDEIAAKLDVEKLKTQYDMFFIKIYGEYDPELVPESAACSACPKNPVYDNLHENSEMCNDKQVVLVLFSPYYNFKDYGIKAAYYVDKDVEYEKRCDNIEFFGKKKNVFMNFIGKLNSI